jgi:hypothetical protein
VPSEVLVSLDQNDSQGKQTIFPTEAQSRMFSSSPCNAGSGGTARLDVGLVSAPVDRTIRSRAERGDNRSWVPGFSGWSGALLDNKTVVQDAAV